MNPLNKRTKLALDVLIVLLAASVCFVAYRKFFPSKAEVASVKVGSKITIRNLDWGAHHQTILMALQEGCPFCSESAPFYRELLDKVKGSNSENVHLMALLPQDPASGKRYLDSLGIAVDDVRQADLSRLGVSATPSLLWLDDKGQVRALWIGKLTSEQEHEVLRRASGDWY